MGYAVAEVLTDALAKSGSTKAAKLNAAISKTGAQTTAGRIKFDQSTHTATTPYYIPPLAKREACPGAAARARRHLPGAHRGAQLATSLSSSW